MKLLICLLSALFLVSCSMEKRKYTKGYHITRSYYFQSIKDVNKYNPTSEISEQSNKGETIKNCDSISSISLAQTINETESENQKSSMQQNKTKTILANNPDSILIISPKVGD